MHESVISISSLIEICQTKAIAIGFKKGHQRTLESYQSSKIECLARSIFCYVLAGRVDVHIFQSKSEAIQDGYRVANSAPSRRPTRQKKKAVSAVFKLYV